MKYIDIDKIRAEIERLLKVNTPYENEGYRFGLLDLLGFLDTLEEPVSDNLEEAAIDFADNARKALYSKDYAISSIADYDHGCIDGFKAGAEWARKQMMKEQQPEVDFEKEIMDYWTATKWCQIMTLSKFKVIARYFYGLGLNARKEE